MARSTEACVAKWVQIIAEHGPHHERAAACYGEAFAANLYNELNAACIDQMVAAMTDNPGERLELTLKYADSYSRLVALLAFRDDPEFWARVGNEWAGCDNIAASKTELSRLLRRERDRNGFPIRAAMSDASTALYATLPEVVRVWRGCYRRNRRGLSWTLNRACAESFPFLRRYQQLNSKPLLLQGTIRRDDIAFICMSRNEDEVIALPSDVTVVAESRIVDGRVSSL